MTPSILTGDAIAHELGHNLGLSTTPSTHRDFIHPNGKRSMMHHALGPNPGDNCMINKEERDAIYENIKTP